MVKTTLCLFKREKRKFNGTKGRLKETIHCASNYLGCLLIASLITLPNINQLVREKGQIKLPSDLTSQVADNIQNHWGRHEDNTRQVVVVFNNGDRKLSANQQDNIDATINSFKHQEKKYHIKSMTAPNENKYTRAQLISKDKTTEILQLNVDKNITVAKTRELITRVLKLRE